MAFDQTSIPNNLRPLNIVRNVSDQPRIVNRAPEGYYPYPAREIGSPDSVPVYCSTVPISDPAGYYIPAPGFGYNPNSAPQASEEGSADDSKKVKFLCSYRGRILPRPSDGALRYVGGHTRIVSVRRDSSFDELVQKMAKVYGNGQRHVHVKYQLPDEDLDSLVSVSSPDDLDNMMDEFEKLNEETDAKPRLFLFSTAELDQSGMVRFNDMNDTNGTRYVDAVNGVGDFGGFATKGSVTSANSAPSDFSGSEAVVEAGLVPGQGDLGLRKQNSENSDVGSPSLVCLDPSPVIKSEVPQMETDLERSIPVTVAPQQIPAPIYVTQSDYLQQIPPQIGFPGPQLMGTGGAMYAPQFIATMNPPSHNVSMAQSILQPQPPQMHSYADERAYGPRVFQLPVEQSCAQYHQVPVPAPSTVVGANYSWHKVPTMQQDHEIPMTYSNAVPMPECYMCLKALPHVHSDTAVQRDSVVSPLSDPSLGYNNLRADDHSRSQPAIRVMGDGAGTQRRGISDAQAPKSAFIIATVPQSSSQMEYAKVSVEPSVSYDQMRPIEGRMEALNMGPSETSEHCSGSDVATELNPTSRLVEHYEVAQAPLWGSPGLNEVYLPSTLPPPSMIGDVQDLSNSLFSNQDPWNMRQDPEFQPPRENPAPESIILKDPFRDNPCGNSAELNTVEGLRQQPLGILNTKDHGSDQSQLSREGMRTVEEQIRYDLQAVAEGVAASVLQSNTSSNPDLHDKNELSTESILDESEAEEVKTKVPERAHLGFPVSDGIGRLQIIKNVDLEELRELGSGTFGTVYHGKWRGTDVAIKRINDRWFAGKPSEQERMRDDFWNEAIKLADLHHPNVLAFYGLVLDGPGGSVATVTEYMVNGSLRNSLQKNEKSLDKRKRLLIAMDVAFGMEYLHGKNIVHFDLKSDNLLVNLRDPHRPICKVGDLGLSKVKCQTLISGGVRGTLPWMAPELLNGSSSLVSEKVDVFSFGIVMWELLTGEEPYADLHYGAIIGGIVSNTLRPAVPESCDPEWKSLMEKCWSAEPRERPSFAEIANHLRSVAAKIPPKAHSATTQQQTTTQPVVQS